jgi:DnaJ like chaperone protein
VYKEKLLQYHPDRVQCLGKEFQDLAEQKTKELNEAYQRILKEHEGDS